MPRGDGTGPRGLGPMTGRGMGYCAGFPVPGYMNPGPGFGFGRGRGWWGRGRGWRNMYYMTGVPGWARFGYGPRWVEPVAPQYSEQQEAEMLKEEADYLEEELKAIKERLKELESSKDDKEEKE
ncbi:MAG: hypothetical protein PWP21_737 [Thermosediminibacterales bacterium]|nr:hypothetical protein [Thermosediminibacterales bacterium]